MAEKDQPGRSRHPRSSGPKTRGRSVGRGGAKRAGWGTISREQIVDAALAYVETTGFEKLTIRSLSAQLKVAPMSLYRHVRDKDDLLDEVADRLLGEMRAPKAASDDWRKWIGDAAEQLRDLLLRQPAARYVYLRHPVVSPAALGRMNTMLEVLHRAGFDDDAAERAYAAVQTYTIGFAALEASREGWPPPNIDVDPIAARLAAYTTPRQFADGLRYLLDGIEHQRNDRRAD